MNDLLLKFDSNVQESYISTISSRGSKFERLSFGYDDLLGRMDALHLGL